MATLLPRAGPPATVGGDAGVASLGASLPARVQHALALLQRRVDSGYRFPAPFYVSNSRGDSGSESEETNAGAAPFEDHEVDLDASTVQFENNEDEEPSTVELEVNENNVPLSFLEDEATVVSYSSNESASSASSMSVEDAMEDALLCQLCFSHRRSMVFLPCRHTCTCRTCYRRLVMSALRGECPRCPFCRAAIQSVVSHVQIS